MTVLVHMLGDQLLIGMLSAKTCLRPGDTVARYRRRQSSGTESIQNLNTPTQVVNIQQDCAFQPEWFEIHIAWCALVQTVTTSRLLRDFDIDSQGVQVQGRRVTSVQSAKHPRLWHVAVKPTCGGHWLIAISASVITDCCPHWQSWF